MHLITFAESNIIRIGVLDDLENIVIDISKSYEKSPQNMLALIEGGADGLAEFKLKAASCNVRIPLSQVKLLAPIPEPRRNIICVGKNYRDHVNEVQSSLPGDGMPAAPIFFTKASTAIIASKEDIPASLDPTQSVDYEGELAVVIGVGGKSIKRERAMSHVFGYTIINDVTSRRLQKKHQQWFLGKSLDGFCPMGPSIVTCDEVADVGALRIETWVNNELRQQGVVSEMIFDIAQQIEVLSQYMTLLPGDIIATGTPAGVGMGFNPPRFLKPGDKVEILIEPIGRLMNGVS